MAYTPHLEKLNALKANPKLPHEDKPRLDVVFQKYAEWQETMRAAEGTPDDVLSVFVDALNSYKKFVEFDFIFCSEQDFLYRQKGQLKLDNTILEEFFPRLIDKRILPTTKELPRLAGPAKCFAGLTFSSYHASLADGGAFVKSKDQDFAVGRAVGLQLRDKTDIYSADLNVAYLVCEIKTNLDKTMFQEASATAKELKAAVSNSKYFLVCEWLDMPPIDTRLTSIDNVVVLRKCKRLNSDVRSKFASREGREASKTVFEKHLQDNPIHLDCIAYLVSNLESIIGVTTFAEDVALERGYF